MTTEAVPHTAYVLELWGPPLAGSLVLGLSADFLLELEENISEALVADGGAGYSVRIRKIPGARVEIGDYDDIRRELLADLDDDDDIRSELL